MVRAVHWAREPGSVPLLCGHYRDQFMVLLRHLYLRHGDGGEQDQGGVVGGVGGGVGVVATGEGGVGGVVGGVVATGEGVGNWELGEEEGELRPSSDPQLLQELGPGSDQSAALHLIESRPSRVKGGPKSSNTEEFKQPIHFI